MEEVCVGKVSTVQWHQIHSSNALSPNVNVPLAMLVLREVLYPLNVSLALIKINVYRKSVLIVK